MKIEQEMNKNDQVLEKIFLFRLRLAYSQKSKHEANVSSGDITGKYGDAEILSFLGGGRNPTLKQWPYILQRIYEVF